MKMPLIPNFARFRTHSQSTAITSSSNSGSGSTSTAGPPTPGPGLARLGVDPPPLSKIRNTEDSAPIARKIHPDLNALLDESSAVDNEASGPLPPRRRIHSAGQLQSKASQSSLLKEAEDELVQHTDAPKPTTDNSDVSASPRSPFLSRILSTPILSGVRSRPATPTKMDPEPESGGLGNPWSTFGRRRVRTSTNSEFGALHRHGSGSKASVHSKSSKFRTQRTSAPVTPSTTRAPSRVQTTTTSTHDTPPSQSGSPAGTVSSSSGSKSHSMHSQSVRSKRYPQTYPEPIPDLELPPSDFPPAPMSSQSTAASPVTPIPATWSLRATKSHLDDSPHTFGRTTPKPPSITPKTLPGLSETLQPPVTSTPLAGHDTQPFPHDSSWTYPTRSHRKPSGSSTINFPSLPIMPFARSRSQSRPRAEDLFQDDNQDNKSGTHGSRLRLGSLLAVGKDDARRRTSADWSAAEAVKNGDSGGTETWPATVSREMVMLSLGDGGNPLHVSGRNGDNVAEVEELGALRNGGDKNPTLFGSTGEERRQLFRAARRWATSRTAIPVNPSSILERSPQLPIVTVSQSTDPATSSPVPAVHSSQKPRTGGLAPVPRASPGGNGMQISSDPGSSGSSGNANKNVTSKSHGKRKKEVESEDDAPPNELGTRSILLKRRDNSTRTSDASHAPSSFRHAKRIRLSTPSHSPPHDRQSSANHSPPGSPGSRPPSSLRTLPANVNPRTLSQSSIPLRAIISPKPPSIDQRSEYHMRDPMLPLPRRMSTQWTGGARKDVETGRLFPLQGWAFIIGFLLFPLWWVAAAAPVGWGWVRRDMKTQDGKGAWSEEEWMAREVVKYDVAYTWRRRCRFMSLLGLFVYIPLIVLLAVLIPGP